MKYLYYIVRLFICKHKYKRVNTMQITRQDGSITGLLFIDQCIKCKKIKEQKVMA